MCWVSESSLPVAQFVRELGIFDNVRYRWISRRRQVQGTLATLRDDREELVALKREGLAVAPEAGGRAMAFVSRESLRGYRAVL